MQEGLACLSEKHILLCEDHPLNQEIVSALLKEKGMLVQIAEDGQKGVDAFFPVRRSAFLTAS
jgi:CheY-like chemotaxis protein